MGSVDDRPDLDEIRARAEPWFRLWFFRDDVNVLLAEVARLEAERDRLQTAIGRHRRRILHLGSYGHQVHDGTAAEQANLDLWREGGCDG
jgi:hypothetical protein